MLHLSRKKGVTAATFSAASNADMLMEEEHSIDEDIDVTPVKNTKKKVSKKSTAPRKLNLQGNYDHHNRISNSKAAIRGDQGTFSEDDVMSYHFMVRDRTIIPNLCFLRLLKVTSLIFVLIIVN
jgi:hypothetical protein